ncbi:stage III sporulation protein AF [Halalkalibacter hemicellulosilyticus]|uniref:Stage III sporulation protein AF n=1 Tax=Halalkalibacter hemicellulosilyticusJCM 9152 TaxID=1236971 RepID=W4QIF0_9BACI|nr:stage III sporulation protein AF [Halalkalibacter hemicellulosilyticus]GAE31871.1 stage III sporulation protein AF [Halalkalibacter hemicellulosilyticusJCM 9152]
MASLTGWLTTIILIILLATILELMLPNSHMQRYVKLVVGLLLLVAMLQPLLSIFTEDVDEWLVSLSVQTDETEKVVQEAINLQKKEIELGQRAYISEQMAVQLENQVKDELREGYDLEIARVEVELLWEGELETIQDAIDSLEVIHTFVYTELEEEQSESDASVEAVQPIRIDISESNRNEDDEQQEFESLADVQQFLAHNWNVPKEKIQVAWEGGKQAK